MGAPLLPGFELGPTFFGLRPEDRPTLHDNIFELVWAGEGRWDWNTIYNMPIFLRNFYIRKLNKLSEMKKQAINKVKSKPSKSKVIKSPL